MSTATGVRSSALVSLPARMLHLSSDINGPNVRVLLLVVYLPGIDGIGVDASSRSTVGLCMNSTTVASIATAVVVTGSSPAVVTALCLGVSVLMLAAAVDVSTLTLMASTVPTSLALPGVLVVAATVVRGRVHGSNSVCTSWFLVSSVVCLVHAELVPRLGVSLACAPPMYTALNMSLAPRA